MVEDLLKAGELPCLVATSSLELGIDMGAIDLVLQVESPKSVDRRPAADRPRRPQRRRRQQGPHLPQVPRRPARVRGRRPAHARGADRDDRRAAQPARRARPADRRDGGASRRRRAERRRPVRARHPHVLLRRAQPRAARERARHARRPLPERGVRRAAREDRLGPRGGHDPPPPRRPRPGHHQRRHDPRPRPVLRQPARRPARRRARRGDGLRGATGADVPARRLELADRGDHPRPRDRLPRPGRPRRGAVLEGRRPRPARRSSARRSAPSPAGPSTRSRPRSPSRVPPRRAGGRQPGRVPARAAGGDARDPERPHDRDRALPRRDRRLAAVHPLPLRRPRARHLGPGAERPHPRAVRPRVGRHLVRRRDHRPPARRRRAARAPSW